MLKRYDLCEHAVWRIRTHLVTLNAGIEWTTWQEAKAELVAAVMESRPGADIEQVKRMVDAIFEADN